MSPTTSSQSWWVRVSKPIHAFPTDIAAILGLLVVANVVLRVPGFRDATVAGARVQLLIAIPVLLFVPGYVLVSALFPGEGEQGAGILEEREPDAPASLDFVERVALSFGMSVALVPIFALVVGTFWGFSRPVVLTSLTAALLVGIVVATVRRFRLPPDARYSVPVDRWVDELRRGILHPGGVVNLVLLLAILAAVGAMGFAVATPYQSGGSSTFYLVTENETGSGTASAGPGTTTSPGLVRSSSTSARPSSSAAARSNAVAGSRSTWSASAAFPRVLCSTAGFRRTRRRRSTSPPAATTRSPTRVAR